MRAQYGLSAASPHGRRAAITRRAGCEDAAAEAGAGPRQLRASVRRAATPDPDPVATGLSIQSSNDTIDDLGRLDAIFEQPVPG